MTPELEYPFINWYLDPEFINVYQVEPVFSDFNLYARFNDNQYTVVFYDSDQITVISSTFAYYGDEVIPPNDPIKRSSPSFDYVFDGWSNELAPVTEDIAFYPLFTKIFKPESVYLLPGLDTISSFDDWVNGGLYHMDSALTYEMRIEADENKYGRYYIYYDLYFMDELIDSRLRVVNVIEENPIVIRLIPDVTTIEVGTKYSDNGIETNLGTITKVGTVNPNVAGKYLIIYTVTYQNYTATKTKYIYVLEKEDLYDSITLYHKKEEEGLFL